MLYNGQGINHDFSMVISIIIDGEDVIYVLTLKILARGEDYISLLMQKNQYFYLLSIKLSPPAKTYLGVKMSGTNP
jgi:hypothetical protein